MRFPIDVAFCDRDGFVLHVANVAPWRISRPVPRAYFAIEASAVLGHGMLSQRQTCSVKVRMESLLLIHGVQGRREIEVVGVRNFHSRLEQGSGRPAGTLHLP